MTLLTVAVSVLGILVFGLFGIVSELVDKLTEVNITLELLLHEQQEK